MKKCLVTVIGGFTLGLLLVIEAKAELLTNARYFSGNVPVNLASPAPCFVEVIFSPDLSQSTTRAVMSLQHLNPEGEYIPVALGPYTATYLADKSLYRYQDATVAALVKDLVLTVTSQINPSKFGVLYWHAAAGHHDPVFCKDLVELSTPEQLQVADDQFSGFDEMKANNP